MTVWFRIFFWFGTFSKPPFEGVGVGSWVAQLVERPPLDFGPGHDLTVREFEPRGGLCTDGAEPARASLSPSLSAPPRLSLFQN